MCCGNNSDLQFSHTTFAAPFLKAAKPTQASLEESRAGALIGLLRERYQTLLQYTGG